MNDFERVKEQYKILEYARELTHLRKTGKVFTGLCPLHSENTPSFTVDPEKELFYCHGCNEGGDIIKLFQLVENIGTYEALERLAERKDIPLSTFDNEGYQRRKEFQQKQKTLIDKASEQSKQKEAVDYLLKRGINQASVTKFRIGYGAKNHSIIIPLADHRGLEIGYCERFIGDPPSGFKGKYRLPSENPESELYNELFKKSEFLFNEHASRKALKTEQYLLVFEGQLDAISADQIGFSAAVACMQSSLTKEQSKRIVELVEQNTVIVLVPDRNKVGMDSIEKNYYLLKSINSKALIKVLLLPNEKNENGKEKDFNDYVCAGMTREQAESYITYAEIGLLEVMLGKTKDFLLQQQYATDIVSQIQNPIVKEHVAAYIAGVWGMDAAKVNQLFSVKTQTSLYEHYKTVGDMYNSFMNKVFQSEQNNIYTGYEELDKHLNNGLGIPTGWVIVFLARSSVGKTAFALNLMNNAIIKHKVGCNFFSFEQQDSDIYPKLVAVNQAMSQKQVFYEYSNFNAELYHTKMMQTFEKNILVFEHQRLTINEIEELVTLADQRFFDEYPCRIVLVDYLGYIKTPGKNRYEEISQLTAEIKQVAKRTKKLFVILAQTSRGTKEEGDGSKPVNFSDARDSGTIEENADILLGAYRPELNKELESYDLIKVLDDYNIQILKNRNGPTGITSILKFDKPKQIIREWRDGEKKAFMDSKIGEMSNYGSEEERVASLRRMQ